MADELAREESERHTEELVKLNFEMCKHLTTLSTAAILVVLAVYREMSFGWTLLGATLTLFGVTIVVSLVSMVLSMTFFTAKGRRDWVAADPILMWTSVVASYLFIGGVLAFMLFLLDLSIWSLVIALAGLFLLRWSFSAYVRRLREARTR